LGHEQSPSPSPTQHQIIWLGMAMR